MQKKRPIFFVPAVLSLLLIIICGSAWGLPNTTPLLNELQQSSGTQVRYSYHKGTGVLRFLTPEPGSSFSLKNQGPDGSVPVVPGRSVSETTARNFLTRFGSLFGISNQSLELMAKLVKRTKDGRNFVRFQQMHMGLPVIAGELVVQTDNMQNVLSVHGEASPNPQLNVTPSIEAADAKSEALQAVAKYHKTDPAKLNTSEPVLSIYNPALLGAGLNGNSLVWRVEVSASNYAPIREFVLIDAHSAYVALHFNQADTALYRKIYDNENNSSYGLPGNGPVRVEGGSLSSVAEVNSAYQYAGDTYNYYMVNHGRDSINNAGMELINTVRYCAPGEPCPYLNAFWNGTQMVFGDGFAAADDVVGHELTHGVTEYESGLFYYMQSGAINESLSDVFGEFIDLTNAQGNDVSAVRWKLGEDLPPSIGIIRDMKNPTLYGDPDRMGSGNYWCGYSDGGGVHSNSGVNNKAAYLMADGDTFNSKTINGLGIAKVSKIYYEAQTNLLTSGSDYADLYNYLQLACQNLAGSSESGITSSDCTQVENAVNAVEMNLQPASCPSPEAPLCESEEMVPVDVFFDDLENGGANWTHSAVIGQDLWHTLTTGYAASGLTSIWDQSSSAISDSSLRMVNPLTIPSDAYLHFKHADIFDWDSSGNYDGGVLEYSIDGTNWIDAEALFDHNGYGPALKSGTGNPLAGRKAFGGESRGYISSRLTLSTLAGQSVRFRFRTGTDSSVAFLGWLIDDVRIYTCSNQQSSAEYEILWRNPSNGNNWAWAMDGTTRTASAQLQTVAGANWNIVGTGDFNGDGTRDIIWRDSTNGDNYVWLMNGTTRTSTVQLQTVAGANWNIVGTGDFNADGKPDIIWRDSTSGANWIWLMNGTTRTGSVQLQTVPGANWNIAGSGDFDGDGKPDIFWRDSSSGDNWVWVMNGTTRTSSVQLQIVPPPWEIAGIGNFNNDLNLDILWRNPTTGENVAWYMNGATLIGTGWLQTVFAPWNIVGH